MIFGHRKCSGGTGYISGHRKGFRAHTPPPRQRYGPYWAKGGTDKPLRGWCGPPIWAGQIGVEKGKGERKKGIGFPPSPSSLPTPNRNRKGGRPDWEDPK